MDVSAVLQDAYGRITEIVHRAIDGADPSALTWQPEPDANPIAWLVWHLTRIQDDHVAELADRPQVWEDDDWAPRFGLPVGTLETGYGHSTAQVRSVVPQNAEVLAAYHDAVAARTAAFIDEVDDAALDRVIDTSYDPPVTMGVRLVSVISDNLQHAGQARYLRGMYDRVGSDG